MTTGPTPARPAVATDQQHQRELALNIFRLLKSNGTDPQPVNAPHEPTMPDDGTPELIQQSRPFNAIRAEVCGKTLTVEVTTERQGEQYEPGRDSAKELWYACYDLSDFRNYLATLLEGSGLLVMPPATTHPREFAMFMRNTPPDPLPAPAFYQPAQTPLPKEQQKGTLTALQRLTALDLEAKRKRYPGVPQAYIPKTKFEDKTTNGLTKCVMFWIELHGGYAPRIQSQGQYNERFGRWTKDTTRKGTADIHGLYNGQHFSIEIKICRDRQSDAQKRTGRMVKRAGGHYYIARNFADFVTWFTAITSAQPVPTPLSSPQPI